MANFMNWLKRGQRNQFVVIGLGRFGTSVAGTLHGLGYEVLAIDSSEERVRRAACENIATQVLQVDATDPDALRQVGVSEFEVVVVAIGSFLQESILATLNAKSLGVPFVVAKANNPLHGTVLEKIGADRIVFPESDMGRQLALSLTSRSMIEAFQLDSEYSIVEIVAPPEFTNRTLRELNVRARFGVSVMAIKHKGKFNVNPGADDMIYQGDLLVVIGDNQALNRLPTAKR